MLYKWKQMYEITSCQISNGNEDDKVVPYIDYNYSFCPVLSPFPIMFMGRGRGWEAVAKNVASNKRRKKKSKNRGYFWSQTIVYFVIYVVSIESVVFLWNIFQLLVLINEKDSVATTGSCNCKVSSQSMLWRQSVWLTKQASLMGKTVTAVADGLPRNEVVYIDLLEKMCLIIAPIIRLIWGKKLNDSLRNTVRLIYEDFDIFPPRNAAWILYLNFSLPLEKNNWKKLDFLKLWIT